jgi:hypothetical protein
MGAILSEFTYRESTRVGRKQKHNSHTDGWRKSRSEERVRKAVREL